MHERIKDKEPNTSCVLLDMAQHYFTLVLQLWHEVLLLFQYLHVYIHIYGNR